MVDAGDKYAPRRRYPWKSLAIIAATGSGWFINAANATGRKGKKVKLHFQHETFCAIKKEIPFQQ